MTNADELLLEWARNEFPKWARERVEQHNHAVGRTKAHNERNPDYATAVDQAAIITAHTLAHIKNCGPQIYAVDHQWECGCYSEFTRDDNWMIHCRVSCKHGLMTDMRMSVDAWDMPEILRELSELDAGDGCMYDDPEYNW